MPQGPGSQRQRTDVWVTMVDNGPHDLECGRGLVGAQAARVFLPPQHIADFGVDQVRCVLTQPG